MNTPVSHRPDERVSLQTVVARSRRLGPPRIEDRDAIPVELVEPADSAAAEGYITAITATGAVTRVELLLDHGLDAVAMLSTADAEWLGLEDGKIVPVRLDRWLDF